MMRDWDPVDYMNWLLEPETLPLRNRLLFNAFRECILVGEYLKARRLVAIDGRVRDLE